MKSQATQPISYKDGKNTTELSSRMREAFKKFQTFTSKIQVPSYMASGFVQIGDFSPLITMQIWSGEAALSAL